MHRHQLRTLEHGISGALAKQCYLRCIQGMDWVAVEEATLSYHNTGMSVVVRMVWDPGILGHEAGLLQRRRTSSLSMLSCEGW